MKYELVQWPESQHLMDHPRFNECLFIENLEGHDYVGSSAYACPEDIYNEIFPPCEPEPQKKQSLASIFAEARKALMAALENALEEQESLELPHTVTSYKDGSTYEFSRLCKLNGNVFAAYTFINEDGESENTEYKDQLFLLSADELYGIASALNLMDEDEDD